MALVHKFQTEQTGTDLFRLTASQDRARTRQAAGEHGLSNGQIPGNMYSFAVRTVDNWNKLPEEVKLPETAKCSRTDRKKDRDGSYLRTDPVKVMDNRMYNNHDRKRNNIKNKVQNEKN
jgi:hypothetical protein